MTAIAIDPDQERIVKWISGAILGYTVLVGLGAAATGVETMAGVLAGGILTYFNFIWFAAIIRGLLTGSDKPGAFAIKTALKVLLLYGAVSLLIGLGLVDTIGFLIGITSLIAAVTAAGFKFWRLGQEKEDIGESD